MVDQLLPSLNIEQKRALIEVARGKRIADIVFRNGKIVNVFSNEVYEADIAVYQGYIAGIGAPGFYHAEREIDVGGEYLVPGLVEAHTHIEDALLTPGEFARLILPHGTTTCISDPHEIANVVGVPGMHWLLKASENLPLRLYYTLPSCVPASPFESSGATITANDYTTLAGDPRIASVGEVMNYIGVIEGDETLLNMIGLFQNPQTDRNNEDVPNQPAPALDTSSFYQSQPKKSSGYTPRGLPIDGHAPELRGADLCAYVAAGVESDHEAVTAEEALEKVRLGMWLWIREGSTRNLHDLLPVILQHKPERVGFVIDDRTASDLLHLGDLDYIIREAVKLGLDPVQAIKMTSINPARYFRFPDRGAIAPGYLADLLVVPDLADFRPRQVYIGGKLVAENGKALFTPPPLPADWEQEVGNTITLKDFSRERLRLPGHSGPAHVICLVPDQIVTDDQLMEVQAHDGEIQVDVERDILKIAVVERYGRGRVGVGLLHGLALRNGALASSVAHDAHNIVVVGTNDADMELAVREIERLQGGLVIAQGGLIVDALPLPIGGIVSPLPASEVITMQDRLEQVVANMGVSIAHPFGFLSFLALSVVPSLKITDFGLLDVNANKVITLQNG